MFSRFFSCEWNCLRRRTSKFRKVFALVAVIAPESGIQSCTMVWNPESTLVWNPESRRLESGIQRVEIQNPESRCWDPESRSWDPESKTFVDSLTWGDCNLSFNSCFVSTIIHLHNSRSSCLHNFSISRFNHNFRKNSSLMCACAVFLFIKYFYCICRASHIPSATW